jgi:hypothetical protein
MKLLRVLLNSQIAVWFYMKLFELDTDNHNNSKLLIGHNFKLDNGLEICNDSLNNSYIWRS